MKINYNQYTVLKCLENKSLNGIGFHPLDGVPTYEFTQFLNSNFKYFNEPFSEKINYMAKPFQDAIGKSFNNLIRDEVWNNISEQYGTILNMRTVFGDISVCYYIRGEKDNEKHEKFIFYFYKSIWVGVSVQDKGNFTCSFSNHWINLYTDFFKKEGFNFNREQIINEIDNIYYSLLIANINFIKYAEVETTFLQPNGKIKDISCKYKNETKSNIRILTSKWFTTLVQSEAFTVRGHFRLQPVGEGRKDRKLIWVNDFQKNGYTSKAQILTEEFTTPIS